MTEQLAEGIIEAPALDEADVDPEGMVGEEVDAGHDLDLGTFVEEDES